MLLTVGLVPFAFNGIRDISRMRRLSRLEALGCNDHCDFPD
jgi:hypothetical protein